MALLSLRPRFEALCPPSAPGGLPLSGLLRPFLVPLELSESELDFGAVLELVDDDG